MGDCDLVFMNKDFDNLFDFHFFDIDDEDSINKTFETLNSINPQIYYYTDKVDEWSIDVRGV
jgi:dsDNA-specific endonuclease/ATPase MutS2